MLGKLANMHFFQKIILSKEFQRAVFPLCLIINFIILLKFYDQFWYPPDDGAYAHVADRILKGEILNLDVHDIHMGYINFANAFALQIFGNNLASLRIPLLIMGIIQSAVIFKYFLPRGLVEASIASILMTTFSFIFFANPTANWYGLFLTITLIGFLNWIPKGYKYRIAIVGFILCTLFLFRQLTGVIVGIGAVAYLLFEAHEENSVSKGLFAKCLFLIMLIGLGGYLYSKISISGILLFGIWPLALLAIGLLKISVKENDTAGIVMQLLVGAVIALLPILSYHIYHGSLLSWYDDTVLSVLRLTAMPFITEIDYSDYIIFSFYNILKFETAASVINGLFWAFLILTPAFVGIGVIRSIAKRGFNSDNINPLTFISVFFALVAVHFHIPIYLFYIIGLTLCAFLWLYSGEHSSNRRVVYLLGTGLIGVFLFYHAGQPAVRPLKEVLSGEETVTEKTFMGGKVNLWLEEDQVEKYKFIRDLVERETDENDSIFAFPSNSEIYYITQRKNPFRFFNSALGVANQKQYEDVISVFGSTPPKVVFYSPQDKYNTEYSMKLAQYVSEHYRLYTTHQDLEIYIKTD